MKVVAINGSPHENGNTAQSLLRVLSILEKHGIETELLQVGKECVRPCKGCKGCASSGFCVGYDDNVKMWTQKMVSADGILLGSPVYFSGVASPLKCFLDRSFYSCTRKGLLKGKVGAAVVAVRRTGGSATLDNLLHYFTYSEMLVSSGSYWAAIHGQAEGEIQQDLEGLDTLDILAENMYWALALKEASKDTVPYPNTKKRKLFNYIR